MLGRVGRVPAVDALCPVPSNCGCWIWAVISQVVKCCQSLQVSVDTLNFCSYLGGRDSHLCSLLQLLPLFSFSLTAQYTHNTKVMRNSADEDGGMAHRSSVTSFFLEM